MKPLRTIDSAQTPEGTLALKQRGERDFLITTGLKSNRALRVTDETAQQGWRWEKLSDYLSGLADHDYVQMKWPRGGKTVFVHVVSTSIRKLYRCQLIIVRQSLNAPLAQARYWASSDLEATPEMLLAHIAARWDIEVLFGDSKEELGLDQYQVMSATAIVRFWTLAMLAYIFLEEERDRLQSQWQRHVTIGEARREIQHRHRPMCSICFMDSSNLALNLTPSTTSSPPERDPPKSAKIEFTSRREILSKKAADRRWASRSLFWVAI